MEYKDEVHLSSFFAALVPGALIGAGIAMVLVPGPRERTRLRLQRAAGDLREAVSDRWDQLAEHMMGRVKDTLTGARGEFS